MMKIIYDGHDVGLYCYGTFQAFMQRNRAEPIRRDERDLFQIWMINDVVVHYENSGGSVVGTALVKLHGTNPASLGQVERIILAEAQKRK